MEKKIINEKTGPKIFLGISRTQLSIAHYYGGIKISGIEYVYMPLQDALVRIDVMKDMRKFLKA